MLYLVLKALHVASVITWIGGMLTVAIILACNRLQHSQVIYWLSGLRAWDRRVTTPAMLLAWVLGLGLASLGHWFPQAWLMAKLGLVLILSGFHGMLVGRLRSLSSRPLAVALPGGFATAIGIILAAAIITVVVITKPHVY
ncbi:CopD family protein [Duganella vulcania]|uniref:Protoporphyrinogen IX oxidase n=1 Tax=Duganella vulcania TaxID=2692166 RepID=A0A845GS92_9BURK|nr:CopD family protein [Duganella vulcania]MYM96078.1 hypothetical protein [Duganella vulcania]